MRIDTDIIVPSVFPIPAVAYSWNQTMVPLAFANPALLHAQLSISSCTIATLYSDSPLEGLSAMQMHKGASIALINKKLERKSDAIQVSTICTIVSLLGIEVSKTAQDKRQPYRAIVPIG